MDTTVSKLRPVLQRFFVPQHVDTALRRGRLSGLVEAGAAGYGGTGSAPLDARQAVGVLMSLAFQAPRLDGRTQLGQMWLRRTPPLEFAEAPPEELRSDFVIGLVIDILGAAAGRRPGDWELEFLLPDRVRVICGIPAELLSDIGGLFRGDHRVERVA
jgi:hypothetical protein